MFYTERLMLRGIDQDADLKALHRYMNDADALRALTFEPARPVSKDQVKKLMEKWSENPVATFMICFKPPPDERPEALDGNDDLIIKDGKTRYPSIGILNLGWCGHSTKGYNRAGRLGIALNEPYRDKGYGTEIMAFAIKYSFETLGMHRLELETDATNHRAQHVYEKSGFVREGIKREYVFRNDGWVDVVEMSILESEYYANGRR